MNLDGSSWMIGTAAVDTDDLTEALATLSESVKADGDDEVVELYQCKRVGVKTVKEIHQAIDEEYNDVFEPGDGEKIVYLKCLTEDYLGDEDVDVL